MVFKMQLKGTKDLEFSPASDFKQNKKYKQEKLTITIFPEP